MLEKKARELGVVAVLAITGASSSQQGGEVAEQRRPPVLQEREARSSG